ncbi:MAG: ribulose-phosphate 3-epimerase [Oscillospiraceae bacterium]
MIKIAPSILSADFARLGDEVRSVSEADYIHCDVMDGMFVPNISFGIPVLKSLRKATDMTLDVHLMIERPLRYVDEFIKLGADIVVFHVESDEPERILESVKAVKGSGKRVGLALRPKTPGEIIKPYIELLDMVLCMTVEPGFGGQSFMSDMLPKISYVREEIERAGLACDVEVDGGINENTARLCVEAGANVLVAGSSIFGAASRSEAIERLRG